MRPGDELGGSGKPHTGADQPDYLLSPLLAPSADEENKEWECGE